MEKVAKLSESEWLQKKYNSLEEETKQMLKKQEEEANAKKKEKEKFTRFSGDL